MTGETTQREAMDPREFRRALGRFVTGITIVTTRASDGAPVGLTANSFSSVSLDPPLVLFSLDHKSASLDVFMQTGFFAVNVLGSHQKHLSNRFASHGADKYGGVEYTDGLGGAPVMLDSIACFECSVFNRVPAGDHTIFLGRVERMTHREGEPLLYVGGQYGVPAMPPA